jgi:tetratricopeptide (TPR) repeat protein
MRLEADVHMKNALRAYKTEDWQSVVFEIDKVDLRFYNLDPTSTPLFWYRGMANYSLGMIDEACTDFQNAYTNNPYHIHAINNLATCYALQQNFGKAKEYYQKALSISPQFQEARHNLDLVDSKTVKFH